MAELELRSVSVRFGGVQALEDVDLRVVSGKVHGLIGPNGAGKTTLFNVATGIVPPSSGQVRIDGTDVTRARPHLRARLGLARTFQRIEICGTLTVRENVQLAVEARRGRRGGPTTAAIADRLLDEVGIGDIGDEPADAVPIGLARLVEIARALAISPATLLLDEPSSGLDHLETAELGGVLRRLADDGMGILLVEHDMGLVMQVCDELTVLDTGSVVAAGDPAAVRSDPAVQAAYLGTSHPEAGRATAGPTAPTGPARTSCGPAAAGAPGPDADDLGPPVLSLDEVRAAYGRIEVLHGVSLTLRRGSVFALLGPNGAGKSTLLKCCSGRVVPTSGTVCVGGVPVGRRTPAALARAGLCAIPEGRAVFANLTVADNLLMATYRSPSVLRQDVEERAFAAFPRLRERRHQLAGTLSGGEQQMLALARALTTEPDVLLIDELSMGLAPLVVEDLYQTVAQLAAAEGLTVLLVEQFAEAALALATEAAVLVNGEIVRQGGAAEVAEEVAGAYLGGG